jgi:hypothetical protein
MTSKTKQKTIVEYPWRHNMSWGLLKPVFFLTQTCTEWLILLTLFSDSPEGSPALAVFRLKIVYSYLHLDFITTSFMFLVGTLSLKKRLGVRRRPRHNRVTWKTPSRRAFIPLQEPVVVLASYVPHTKMPVWSETSVAAAVCHTPLSKFSF